MATCGPAEPIRLVPLPPGVDYPWRTSTAQPDADLRAAFRRAHLVVDNARAGSDFYAAQWTPLPEGPGAQSRQPTQRRDSSAPVNERMAEQRVDSDDSERSAETVATTESPDRHGAETASTPIDVNTASSEDLQSLRGIGPSLAARIVDGRPYSEVEDLLTVHGIGPATLDRFREMVTVR